MAFRWGERNCSQQPFQTTTRGLFSITKFDALRFSAQLRLVLTAEELRRTPSPLAAHYARFRVAERLLLTGHSHQAWPDVGFDGQTEAWADAAEHVDEKWERAAERAARVRHGFARLLGARSEEIALGQNTHELVTRFLSALPLRERRRLVTTDGELHTIRRRPH